MIGDRVRVTTAPWVDAVGTIESVDGAYNIVRLDTSEHPDDVLELYPNEFKAVDEEKVMRHEVIISLKYRNGYWKSQGYHRELQICDYFLNLYYFLNKRRLARLVFSNDLTTRCAMLVTAYSRVPKSQVQEADGFVRRPYTFFDTRQAILALQERWGQDTLAVWIEQDWER